MTNGLVSVLRNDEVIVKVVAGCNGYLSTDLSTAIQKDNISDPEAIFNLAKKIGFGSQDCLVVQDHCVNFYDGDESLGILYYDQLKFKDPKFNPRWECGICSCTEIVHID